MHVQSHQYTGQGSRAGKQSSQPQHAALSMNHALIMHLHGYEKKQVRHNAKKKSQIASHTI